MEQQPEERITRAQWEERYAAAKRFMQERVGNSSVLIEVAAQHPLQEGRRPNEEFARRLLLGRELYAEAEAQGRDAVIYVPGSRHMHDGVADEVALSQAGVTFLRELGMPENALRGEDLNRRYKGSQGVYNSADECYVAASYFRNGNFGQLHSVLSPVQLYRKALHYIWFGVVPLFHTAPTVATFHNYIREAYDLIPYVRDLDPDLQGANSHYGNLWRRERTPREPTA